MRRALLPCLALLLTACGQAGGKDPFIESRLPPSISPRFYPPEGWAWGLVQAGDYPPQRYGVSAPATAPRAHLLILPGYGESAEAWFETAADFNRQGYDVWVLEGAGQGGSGRFTLPRDVGYVPDLEPDLLAIKAMVRVVIPDDGRAVVVLGQQSGAVLAVLAAQRGWTADGLILSSPPPAPHSEAFDEPLSRIGLGWLRDPREPGWNREGAFRTGPPGREVYRRAVEQAWQQANPDLRMAGPSVGHRALMAKAQGWAASALRSLPDPVLALGGAPLWKDACAKAPACIARPPSNGAVGPYSHLETDGPRADWLSAVDGFLRNRQAERLSRQERAPGHGE